jgi:hypothetical protein
VHISIAFTASSGRIVKSVILFKYPSYVSPCYHMLILRDIPQPVIPNTVVLAQGPCLRGS